MADARVDPDYGTREEDWFDPDADSDADGYAENMERVEAAAQACMERSLQQRQEQCSSRADTVNAAVPESLYDKARDQQDQLTQEERNILLGRNDVIGRALAQPDSLTVQDVHDLFCWPLPDVARNNIQRATGGRLSTPIEVYAKAKEAIDGGNFETLTNAAQVQLLTNGFHEKIDGSCPARYMAAFHSPGYGHAVNLISRRLIPDLISVTQAAARRQFPPRASSQPVAIATPISQADFQGGPWPPASAVELRSAMQIFMNDSNIRGYDAGLRWSALPEAEKETYRTRSEAVRREAWAWYETAIAQDPDRFNPTRVAPHRVPLEVHVPQTEGGKQRYQDVARERDFCRRYEKQVYGMPKIITGLGLFCNERSVGTGSQEFHEVLQIWRAMSEEQRDKYNEEAKSLNVTTQAADR
ncbi:hypothetical protein BN1723_009607 [Verticillium longisporum]|uniref:Uncharacterized protein n=1 Tax=Verticillium longisporum TaxID=100787 RepID=A0A0G4KZ33_VERLO|nr:hypothetical protein BN1723_009607 [Verticillium longisporum]CRK14685.1 hypothetical protein BN1708_011210 [Verticillium longisporum]